jgi:DNA-binding MarR family transcriptional regulator
MNGKSERSLAIEAEIVKRFPCQEIPMGGITEIAAKYGVSKQRVHQIAKRLGVSGTHFLPGGKARAINSKICKNCGNPKEYKKVLCKDCRFPRLSFDVCGKLFRRDRKTILRNNAGRGAYCSWDCRNEGLGTAAAEHHGKTPGETRALVKEYMDWMSVSDMARLIGVTKGTIAFHITRIREGK